MRTTRAKFIEAKCTPLLQQSKKGVYITFVKKTTGSVRYMLCTLNESLIPLWAVPKGEGNGSPAGLIKVFDLQKMAWRSFYWNSVDYFTAKK